MRQLERKVDAKELSKIISIPKSYRDKRLIISIRAVDDDRAAAVRRLRGCIVDEGLTLDQFREERLMGK